MGREGGEEAREEWREDRSQELKNIFMDSISFKFYNP